MWTYILDNIFTGICNVLIVVVRAFINLASNFRMNVINYETFVLLFAGSSVTDRAD